LIEKRDSKLSRVTHIFYLGACSSTSEKNASYLIKNNYEYTKTLAHFAHDRHIRFVYASSAATYGNGSGRMSDERFPNIDLRPLNMYGYSKHLFDLYAAKNNLCVYGMKYFNVFGPNEYHKGNMRSMVIRAYESVLAIGKIYLFKSDRTEIKDGDLKRDFLYVKDAINMTIFLGEVPEIIAGKPTCGIYNFGSGVASMWKELASAVFNTMDREVCIEFIDIPSELKGKYQYYTCADISKLRSIGYSKQMIPLGVAVKDYVQNYLMQGMKILNY
jgi:ADP-L-glycero-D-manno-heptose 6-epimerase